MIIPQATLAGVLKKKQQQYHSQIDKESSARLYAKICDEFKSQLKALDAEATVVCGTFGNRRKQAQHCCIEYDRLALTMHHRGT